MISAIHNTVSETFPAITKTSRFVLREALHMIVPRLDWVSHYTRSVALQDLMSGILVASVLIPNAMAYSLLAGVEPIMGLYAACVGAFVGALWGSSRHVVTGPVGIVSLLTLTSLSAFAAPNTSEFFTLAIALAILVGIMQFALGFFKMGFIMRLIPHSVLIGFATAAAIIIAMSQVPALLGYKVTSHTHVFQTLFDTIHHMGNAHLPTALLGFAAVVLVLISKRVFPKLPIQLVLLIAAGLASYFFSFGDKHVALIGYIPSALPSLNFHALTYDSFITLLGKASVISIVGFVETYAIARTISRKTKEKIDANQELVGQGLANVGSGLLGGFSVSGSFSLSALNTSSGARTRLANVYAALIVLATIIFLAPYMYYLPKSVLAAFVIVAVSSMINFNPMKHLLRVSRTDAVIAIATFIFAFVLKPDDAVFIGIIVALVLFMRRIMWVDVNEVGIHQTEHVFYVVDRVENLKTCPHILIVRMDMPLMYANSDRMVREIEKALARRIERTGDSIKALVIHCAGISFVDATGLEGIEALLENMHERGIEVAIIHPRYQMREILTTSGLMDKITYLHGLAELEAYCDRIKA